MAALELRSLALPVHGRGPAFSLSVAGLRGAPVITGNGNERQNVLARLRLSRLHGSAIVRMLSHPGCAVPGLGPERDRAVEAKR